MLKKMIGVLQVKLKKNYNGVCVLQLPQFIILFYIIYYAKTTTSVHSNNFKKNRRK